MKQVVKQVVGVDVSQKELVVCAARMFSGLSNELYASKVFTNTTKGFEALLSWTQKVMQQGVPVRYVMEATGVYHESLACWLDERCLSLSIVSPNKISNYARSLELKTITDRTASQAIARFGLERQLQQWCRTNDMFKRLRQLSRERNQIIDERTVLKNQLHAEQAEAQPYKKSIERVKKRIALLDKQENEILQELAGLVKTDNELKKLVTLLCTISGVGFITACSVLGETDGFNLMRNKRQLTSYAGLDVKEKQSGTSVKGKPCISKKGNKNLRRALHMPALTAIRTDQRFKAVFTRLVSKHGIKMKAVVAVQRKLLEMMYTIYKTQTRYDKNYLQNQHSEKQANEKISGILV